MNVVVFKLILDGQFCPEVAVEVLLHKSNDGLTFTELYERSPDPHLLLLDLVEGVEAGRIQMTLTPPR